MMRRSSHPTVKSGKYQHCSRQPLTLLNYRGASGTMMLKNQQTIASSKQIEFAVKQVEEIKKSGNHVTAMLS